MFVIYADTVEEFKASLVNEIKDRETNRRNDAERLKAKGEKERELARANELNLLAIFIEDLKVWPKEWRGKGMAEIHALEQKQARGAVLNDKVTEFLRNNPE
jgi:hypothetical protein